ncbi:MAG TPA: mucoidy inhibitor MuiA family protein [Kofleriaceae bacterium]
MTVLEDRASIVRRGTVALAAGQQRVTIDGVSPILVDKTLLATATGARVLDVRCERVRAPWRDREAGARGEDAAALRTEREGLARSLYAAESDAAVASRERDALGELGTIAWREAALAAARGTAAAELAAQLAALDTQMAAADERHTTAELAATDARLALQRLDVRLARAEAEAGLDEAKLVIDLAADAAGDVALEVMYVVPGAAWRPYHRAQLDVAAKSVEWQATACVWQATGEDWTDVELVCSLERASLGVEPPELADDELATRRREERVVVEAREQEHETTSLGGGPPEVPGIDDGGLGLVLTAPRATVRADGSPHRVPVGGFTAPAQISLVAIPLRSPWVHVRAKLANAGTTPLLAGPVDLMMASGYVGRAEVELVAPGETFALGFGPESDVRAHRTETTERDEAGLLGSWDTRTTRVVVRLSNLGRATRTVQVTERVPISEIEQVEVVTSSPTAMKLAGETQVTARAIDDRGIVTWDVELPPGGGRAVALEYKVKSQRGTIVQ